jgi:hypothetical protein
LEEKTMNTKFLWIWASLLAVLLAACAPAATPAAPVQMPLPAATQEVAVQNTTSGVEPVSPASLRMVIKNADIQLLVEDANASLTRITQLAADMGGYVINSQTEQRGEYVFANAQIAVPSAQFEAALAQLRNASLEVMRESATGQDVSAEYIDLRSRLTNLEATSARVREFLAGAKTVEESLKVNAQLSELEAQIEQVKGQMKYYEGRAAFSTITVAFVPQTAPVQAKPTEWNPGETFKDASDVFVRLAQSLTDVAIWLVVVLGPFALIAFAIIGVGVRFLRPRKEKA